MTTFVFGHKKLHRKFLKFVFLHPCKIDCIVADVTHPDAAVDARSLVQELTGVPNDPVEVAKLPAGVLLGAG